MGFSDDLNFGFQALVAQVELICVFLGFLGSEDKDQLLGLAYLKDAFIFVEPEVRRHSDVPLGGLLSDVSNHDGFFSFELDRDEAEIQLIWEIQHGAAAACADGNDELFTFSDDSEVVGIVDLGLGTKADDVADLHAWGDL